MKFRLLASTALLGSIAYACGPSTRADASADLAAPSYSLASMSGSPVLTATHERTLKKESASLATKFEIVQRSTGVQLALRVVNSTGKRVEVTFPTGQAYDFAVVDSVGREVWHWADGRIFTQSVQNKLLGKGEKIEIAEEWSPARRGKFTAIATLRSSNYPVEERIEFVRK